MNVDTEPDAIHILSNTMISLTGTATTCGGTPLASGIAIVYNGGLNYTTLVNAGFFNMNLSNCWKTTQEATIAVFDDALKQSSKEANISLSGTQIEAGNFEVCGNNSSQYAHAEIKGDSMHFSPIDIGYCGVQAQDSSWVISFRKLSDNRFGASEITIQFPVRGSNGGLLGSRLASHCVVAHDYIYNLYAVEGIVSTLLTVDVHEAGAVGEYIRFTFKGSLYNPWDALWTPISGELRALRTY